MGRALTVLLVVVVVLVVLGAAGAYIYAQYKQLKVDVDGARSGVAYVTLSEIQLRIVLVFSNGGSIELLVPRTTFNAWADGTLLGPGDTPEVRVPAGGTATAQALLTISSVQAPAAYLALADAGKDTIRVKGDAHLQVLGFDVAIPFEQSFTVDA
jgi:LEA14-like dessication related protein